MKEILAVMMMCLMGTVTFAETRASFSRQCTAHYYLTVFDGGKEYLIYTEITASTCAGAMSAAKDAAVEVFEAM